ncbi:MAG: 50S ribosomal protein L29 [Candidatus Micrarchaeota archaeon]|nr:50S ribosomal protein L29 [Candidatus Micrarchaeota archaeon]
MAIIKKGKIREMSDSELSAKLFEFQKELNSERGKLASGGRTSNPGKISELRRSVARVLTIIQERKLGIRVNAPSVKTEAKKTEEKK